MISIKIAKDHRSTASNPFIVKEGNGRILISEKKPDIYRPMIFAHELGHIKLKHMRPRLNYPISKNNMLNIVLQELEAWTYAQQHTPESYFFEDEIWTSIRTYVLTATHDI